MTAGCNLPTYLLGNTETRMSQESDRLSAIARPHATVADKIRALSAAGVARADIARFLGKRYQHVRNVLEGDAQAGGGYVLGKADLSGVNESSATYETDLPDPSEIDRRSPGVFWLRVRPDGSLPLPAELVEALQAQPGNRVFAEFKDGGLRVVSLDAAMDEARTLVRKVTGGKRGLVDDFLARRKAMWGEAND